MPFIIESILPQSQQLISVKVDDAVQMALDLMIEHDFSQLIVVDSQGKLEGLITSDSILKALSFFQATVDQLKVSHALIKVKDYRIDDDLSELLKRLRDLNAVPITDKEGYPKGIITSFDTTEYFRTRAEDIMLAEDVETTLRDFIESFYKGSNDDVDEQKLNEAIEAIMTSGKDVEKKFQKALQQYLGQCSQGQTSIDKDVAKQVFERHLSQPSQIKKFSELTLYEYIQLFRKIWDHYQESFKGIDLAAIDNLLATARSTRNAIAHFREITPQQREHLKFCADFLDRHRPTISTLHIETGYAVGVGSPVTITIGDTVISNKVIGDQVAGLIKQIPDFWQSITASTQTDSDEPSELGPPAEELGPADSRYAPLAVWLQNQESNRIFLSFEEIEAIIQDALPTSARKHRNWWANDTVSHSQSQQWIEAGWRVSNVNISEERVIFSRAGERQIAYVNFFSALRPKLESIPNLSVKPSPNAQGRHWFTFEVSAENHPATVHVLSFARGSRLRLELYIDVNDRDRNKRIFDYLQAQHLDIEADFGAPLSWERLIGQRSARVAVYRDNSSITDTPEHLEEMQTWLIETLPRFYKALAQRFQTALQATEAPSGN